MKILIKWLLSAVAIVASAYIIPGVTVDTFVIALIVALVLGIINITLKPVLLILTLPINFLTLGLFTVVINAFLIMFADSLVDGFTVTSFFTAILFSLVLGIVNAVLSIFK